MVFGEKHGQKFVEAFNIVPVIFVVQLSQLAFFHELFVVGLHNKVHFAVVAVPRLATRNEIARTSYKLLPRPFPLLICTNRHRTCGCWNDAPGQLALPFSM